uniref:Col_cuticle_N domain-containing protein n=1 Tax=Angiostrongylus cantonensis TaxID=6313 RepID=A0A0K0DGR1_ANGCA
MDGKEIDSYRLTYTGITVAAVATITSVIVVPLLFSCTQNIQLQLEVELKFCVVSTHDLFDEMRKVSVNLILNRYRSRFRISPVNSPHLNGRQDYSGSRGCCEMEISTTLISDMW